MGEEKNSGDSILNIADVSPPATQVPFPETLFSQVKTWESQTKSLWLFSVIGQTYGSGLRKN